jgi:hypothetical protein
MQCSLAAVKDGSIYLLRSINEASASVKDEVDRLG